MDVDPGARRIMIPGMAYPRFLFLALFVAAPLLRAELVLPPGVAVDAENVAVYAEAEVYESSEGEYLSDRDYWDARFMERDFYQDLEAKASVGETVGWMAGEVSLNRAADGQVLEYVLVGGFTPKTMSLISEDLERSTAESTAQVSFEAYWELTYPTRVTVEIQTLSNHAMGTVAWNLSTDFGYEQANWNPGNGDISRTYSIDLNPGVVRFDASVGNYGAADFHNGGSNATYNVEGGALDYAVRVTLDPDENFTPPLPTLTIGPSVNDDYPLAMGNLQPGWKYRLERSASLDDGSWTTSATITAELTEQVLFVQYPLGRDRVFYRLVPEGDDA